MSRPALLVVWALWTMSAGRAASAQQAASQPDAEIDRMVSAGQVELLEKKLSGGTSTDHFRLLALAHANKAARSNPDSLRQKEFESADKRFRAWITALEGAPHEEREKKIASAAAARIEYANMILSLWAAPQLDAFELTQGKRGDNERLSRLLQKAREQYQEALEAIEPLVRELAAGKVEVEDRYLVQGIYDQIKAIKLDAQYNQSWANLFLTRIDPKPGPRRTEALKAAQAGFSGVLDSGSALGEAAIRARLGSAMTLAELGAAEPAQRAFSQALEPGLSLPLEAQIRYEQARALLRGEKFDEGRTALRPLLDKDPQRLPPEDRPARFYLNLALLWDANSYLVEAQSLTARTAGTGAEQVLQTRSQRLRETGMSKMSRLAARGGQWPGLVQLYVGAVIKPDSDPKTQSAAELLYTARGLVERKKFGDALARLAEAAVRPDVDPALAADILFETATVQYTLDDLRSAAETFGKFARQFPSHEKAGQAAQLACQAWSAAAEKSRQPGDYQRLADALLQLLQSFPEHEKRADAQWWLPLALEQAGRWDQAAEQFQNVPANSPHAAEARFRAMTSAKLALEAQKSKLGPQEYRSRADRLTSDLLMYSRQARSIGTAEGLKWSATTLISAAELCGSPELAQWQRTIDLLESFEKDFPRSPLLARVLGARLRAFRELGQADQAAQIVRQLMDADPAARGSGGALATLAQELLEQLERMEQSGDEAGARDLARNSVAIFEELARSAPGPNDSARGLEFALARVLHAAGRDEDALRHSSALVTAAPRDGNFRRLQALILTSVALHPGAASNPATVPMALKPDEALARAGQAWSALLSDNSLRKSAPSRYYEARYWYFEVLLAQGRSADVVKAISQERIWYPDLGGPPWAQKLRDLETRARETGESAGTNSAESRAGPDAGPEHERR